MRLLMDGSHMTPERGTQCNFTNTPILAPFALQVVVYNRTPAKARAVADRFQGVAIEALTPQALKDATGGRELVAIVSTIPAAAGFTVRRLVLVREGRGGPVS